ncbi:hypothetical protein CJF42_04665 [Pseudoalteromonas sp. NBT06-2]|uniref:hypothetical protein n=1 Tax=Pseudoalteromonas sp. NBT06-2 TaxID=2025950 RepID=UPI000BA6F393|nr:hypothetical protein [Pseudoalteromonas sp. NBT06-2]PAJ75613.1 hypothetical protein CJF42_04665 [Pseudoalteromonas sp. NBT06-2]
MINDNLYKFRTLDVNSLAALASKKLWFSNYEGLNDPAELHYKITEEYSDDDYIKYYKERIKAEEPYSVRKIHPDEITKYFIKNRDEFLKEIKWRISPTVQWENYAV